MKSFDDKKELLCGLAELYLDTLDRSHINVNDGVLNSNDLDSVSFLILMALVNSENDSNYFAQGLNIYSETQKEFVDKEFEKVMVSKLEAEKKGKIILDDAKEYYNRKYNNASVEEINEISRKLGEMGFHI